MSSSLIGFPVISPRLKSSLHWKTLLITWAELNRYQLTRRVYANTLVCITKRVNSFTYMNWMDFFFWWNSMLWNLNLKKQGNFPWYGPFKHVPYRGSVCFFTQNPFVSNSIVLFMQWGVGGVCVGGQQNKQNRLNVSGCSETSCQTSVTLWRL